tara:strand:+ start:41 stop:1351 length:1311 start_codon:yes stop_codon:yes gene_type:complete
MFSGLSKEIKNLLPKQLFYRALLIVALPVIILQITISIVFFDSLWIKTNKGMTSALVSEIKTFINAYDNDQTNKDFILILFKDDLNLNIEFKNKTLPKKLKERWYSPIDRSLRRELKSKNLDFSFNSTTYKKFIDLKIGYKNGYFQFFVPRNRLAAESARVFALWITLPAILVIGLAIIFLKNQTRPITKLAQASERFGRGEDIEEFRPSGALEIRKAGYEFDKMRKRIQKHLNQRSEMLSGISHDLRTPLTRIKLQLAFIENQDIVKKISDDVDEMEKMLNEYLQFSSTGANEKTTRFDINELIQNIIKKYNNSNISFENTPNIYFSGRKNLIRRSLNNFIDNSLKYGKKINISIKKIKKNLFIYLEDDGPGIPKDEHENVFKPFYKIDKSRGESRSSVGLGLSISSDIIKSHGGNIELDKSELGGLLVKISLPF